MASVHFFFDVGSPYSFLGATAMQQYEKKWNLSVDYHPFLLGAVMHATGNKSPVALPAKALHLTKDLARTASYYGTTCIIPNHFPTNTLQCQRFLQAIKSEGKDELMMKVAMQLWRAFFQHNMDIGAPEGTGIRSALEDFPLLSDEQVSHYFTLSQTAEVKELLKQTTQKALDEGAFGAPWIVVSLPDGSKESFFGADRFHLIEHLVGCIT